MTTTQEAGKKGGSSKSLKKSKASRKNIAHARRVRAKKKV